MESLRMPSTKPGDLRKTAIPIQNEIINEAIKFKLGSIDNKFYTTMYKCGNYEFKLGKPGKEFGLDRIKYKDGQIGNNPNDMTPTVFKDGELVQMDGSFKRIFKQFISILPNEEALRLLACLFIRNALVLDHRRNMDGYWRYSPPEPILKMIRYKIPSRFGEPIESLLFYTELIALNEDIKYKTLGHEISKGPGRFNNLMHYANIINLILHKSQQSEEDFLLNVMDFAGNLSRPPVGLNPISLKRAFEEFPMLRPL